MIGGEFKGNFNNVEHCFHNGPTENKYVTFGMCCNLLKNAIYSWSIHMNSEESASAVVWEYLWLLSLDFVLMHLDLRAGKSVLYLLQINQSN